MRARLQDALCCGSLGPGTGMQRLLLVDGDGVSACLFGLLLRAAGHDDWAVCE